MEFSDMIEATQQLTGLPVNRAIRLLTINIALISGDLVMAAGMDVIPVDVAGDVLKAITDSVIDCTIDQLLA